MTAAQFKARRTEFANTPDALVEAEIADAELRCPESVWGDKRDLGVALMVAQSLALSPAGRGMELSHDGATVYDQRLSELQSVVAGGGRVI